MTSRPIRGLAVLATGALLSAAVVGPASADSVRDGQWALQKYGAADSVWPVSQGDGVIVAVIDSGVAEHQDLAGQVLPGADFPSGNSLGRSDSVGHGTGMASLIAGRGHDSQNGIMGLAPRARILPIKVDLSGDSDDKAAASAIRFAVDHGAKVINMSFAGPTRSAPPERDAIKYAIDKDVVLVAGAGNSPGPVGYPAAMPGVVAVSAIDDQGAVWDDSGRGPQVTLAAPGVNIYHADAKSPSAYSEGNGTSDASAYVSAIAALVRSKYPNLSAGQVINRMIKSAAAPPDKSAVPNDRYGYGIASPSRALTANPAVDNGPKDNPLVNRAESQGDPGSAQPSAPSTTGGNKAAAKSSNTMLYAIGGGILVVVLIILVIVLVIRSRNNRGGGGGYGGGPGAPGGYPYAPQGQPQQAYPPQQPPSGNPYQR